MITSTALNDRKYRACDCTIKAAERTLKHSPVVCEREPLNKRPPPGLLLGAPVVGHARASLLW